MIMKRYISTLLVLLLLFAAPASAGNVHQTKEKSGMEMYMRQVAKIKSDEIDYTYISASMFKQMFAMLGPAVEGVANPLATIRCMRQFESTGSKGYALLSKAMDMFMQEDEEVMGMKLIALNRDSGVVSAIYGDSGNVLVIKDEGGEVLQVVFISGLPYDVFKALGESGLEIGL